MKNDAKTAGVTSNGSEIDAARMAKLRYFTDQMPGLTRKRAGKGFAYYTSENQLIRDKEILRRIKALAIPPAWTDVWICPQANGHLQATGRDSKGRKQYRYHARWRSVRDETKYDRVVEFGKKLPAIRKQIQRDLALPGLPREKVLATVVRLLETTLIRVGNEEYARNNNSFGLTTMRDNHVKVNGAKIHFRFRGKSGIKHDIDLTDKQLAKIVKRCRDLPGQELFQYLDETGEAQSISSTDVNEYLRAIAGSDFTAKDFRTWAGTVLAAVALQEYSEVTSQTDAKHHVARAIETVAERLGNTPNVCRKCYVHPAILEAYQEGTLPEIFFGVKSNGKSHALQSEELAVLKLLQRRLEQEAKS